MCFIILNLYWYFWNGSHAIPLQRCWLLSYHRTVSFSVNLLIFFFFFFGGLPLLWITPVIAYFLPTIFWRFVYIPQHVVIFYSSHQSSNQPHNQPTHQKITHSLEHHQSTTSAINRTTMHGPGSPITNQSCTTAPLNPHTSNYVILLPLWQQ